MAVAVPITLGVTWIIQRYYLRTFRQLRLLDLELKSAIHAALTETIEGVVTIRGSAWQTRLESKFQSKVGSSQRAVYLLYMIQRWLNFVLEYIAAASATLLVALATQPSRTTSPSTFGVGCVSLIGFSQSLSQFISFYTDLELFSGLS
jgi:ATP-binding cassette subfamily C (CFTR/MRP) protein 1